jgi:hypothetical protein
LLQTARDFSSYLWRKVLDSQSGRRDEWTRTEAIPLKDGKQELDAENRVTAHTVRKPVHVPKDGWKFADKKELARLMTGWPGTRLVEIWNKLPDAKQVLRFENRRTAVKRIWEAIEHLQPVPAKHRAAAASGRGRRHAKTDPRRMIAGIRG